MIAHPLTLLFCWLIGTGLSSALGYVLSFAGELCADAARFGWFGHGFYAAALAVLALIGSFARGLFVGAAMRLLAEPAWRSAAAWALLAVFLARLIGVAAPLSLYPAVGLALLSSPGFLLTSAAGCGLGAYACERNRDARELEAVAGFLRSWMFWERGGAF